MITVHCVDTSGSMGSNSLVWAQQEVLKRFKPKDIVVLFSMSYLIVSDLDRPFTSYPYNFAMGAGTDATEVLEFVKAKGANSILYSDGQVPDDQLKQFNTFINIQND